MEATFTISLMRGTGQARRNQGLGELQPLHNLLAFVPLFSKNAAKSKLEADKIVDKLFTPINHLLLVHRCGICGPRFEYESRGSTQRDTRQ